MIEAHQLVELGNGLCRPECVLTHSSGLIFTSNWYKSGGISVICPNGETSRLLSVDTTFPIKPNGIALERGGSFLMAHLGDSDGGIYRLSPNGSVSNVVTHANGHTLPPTNYVTVDTSGRIWITVSTTQQPRYKDYRASAGTGFIAVAEPGQSDARIVADNLGYANECVIDTDNEVVYINETFTRQLTRFDLASDGALSNKEIITRFPSGTYPDGVALDSNNNLWICSIVSNKIIKVTPDGKQTLILADADESFVDIAEKAYLDNTMNREHLATTGNTTLANTSSLAFGGTDLTIAYIGNLLGQSIHQFDAGVSGKAPVHWNVSLDYLAEYIEHR